MGRSLFSWAFIICGQIKVTDIKVLDRKKYGFLRTVLGERMDNEYARVLFIFIGSA